MRRTSARKREAAAKKCPHVLANLPHILANKPKKNPTAKTSTLGAGVEPPTMTPQPTPLTTRDAEIARLTSRVTDLETQLVALGDLAVGIWDDKTVGKVDALVKNGPKYKDVLRTLFVDNPAQIARLTAENEMLKADLAWLEQQTISSRTGISFDYCRHVEDGRVFEKGFRFMKHHFLGKRCDTLRAAIRAARKNAAPK